MPWHNTKFPRLPRQPFKKQTHSIWICLGDQNLHLDGLAAQLGLGFSPLHLDGLTDQLGLGFPSLENKQLDQLPEQLEHNQLF